MFWAYPQRDDIKLQGLRMLAIYAVVVGFEVEALIFFSWANHDESTERLIHVRMFGPRLASWTY